MPGRLRDVVLAWPPHSRARASQPPPNIVLMYPDNLGYGEVGIYGGNRGVPTPRLDALARQGMRLTNFNVETFCTPSRAALLTGRYGVRSGTLGYTQPWSGMTLWETTLAELLAPRGYASALFGKWHLGNAAGRAPTHQGFDEWYGIRDSSNESQRSTMNDTPYIWEGKAGEPSTPVKEFNLETRRTVDRESTERAVDFMTRSTQARKPFFLYLPFTLIHFPTLPHPEFAGKTGAGDIGDAMAEMDRNVGVVLDALKRLGIERNTIVIWASDGGAEARRPWRGTPGPWRGFYNTAMEGGIRTPVHDPLAGPHPGGTGLERDRAQHRCVHDARRRGRRQGAEGPRHRRRRPAAVLRGPAGEVEPRGLPLLRAERAGARGQVGRLEAALRVAGRTRPAGRSDDEAVQPALRSQGGDRHQGRQSVGAERDRKDRERVLGDGGQVPADPGRHA